jgi:succinyldiaminopimelate transaminase
LHPDGIVDLSVGTPVDPTPAIIQQALAQHSDAPGYPLTTGMPALREAITRWCATRLGATGDVGVLPTLGSKELVAWLPTLLGAKRVLYPQIAYPTYDVGARLAHATGIPVDSDPSTWPAADLVWLNSPSNPTGAVLSRDQLASALEWARANNAVIASDECYLEFGWQCNPLSLLEVAGSDLTNVLVVHSLSKRSNLAGYRAGFVAGDPVLIARLLEIRKHAGMILAAPVQHAVIAALSDSAHVALQRTRYERRRQALRPALERAGFQIVASEAGLYLWATRDEESWLSVGWLAERGILVAPGAFYGAAGEGFVRVALTATDERIDAAVSRLS